MTPPLAEALPEAISPHTIWWIVGFIGAGALFLFLRKVWIAFKEAVVADVERRIGEVEAKLRDSVEAKAQARSEKLLIALADVQETLEKRKHGR